MTVEHAAQRLGIPPRTMRQTIARMEDEGLRIGESKGRYRALSEEDLAGVARWRQVHPPGRPRRRRE